MSVKNGSYRYLYSNRQPSTNWSTDQWLHDGLFLASQDSFWKLAVPSNSAVPGWAQDLHMVVKAIHLADRRSERKLSRDHWTRDIDLTIAVQDKAVWETLLPELHELAGLLTADRWRISVTGGSTWRGDDGLWPGDPVDRVALFSGGIDSTCYAAERQAEGDERIAFVSFQHGRTKGRQKSVFEQVRHRTKVRDIRQGVRSEDLSSRTRGLLFVGTAIFVAAAHQASNVIVPENGQLAVNPALTPSRRAACSTRSVHPRTLMLINRLIAQLGGDVEVCNPFLELTKGEVCRRALAADLAPKILIETISCGHPPVNTGSHVYHCGHCFPCLVRRSAIIASLGYDTSDYLRPDFWNLDQRSNGSDDAYALCQWLSRTFTARDLIADVQLPNHEDIARLLPMLERGRGELAAMFNELVPAGNPLQLMQSPERPQRA